jgi:hypothetical protein
MTMLTRVVLTVVGWGFAAMICGAEVGATQQPFSLTISTPQSTVKAGTEVKVNITMMNITNHEIYYVAPITGRETDLQSGFRTDVRDSQGKPAIETTWGLKVHGTDPHRRPFSGSVVSWPISLKPGQVFEKELTISKEYNLNEPGKYTIQVDRSDTQSDVVIKSNVITVTVTP